MFVGPVRVDMDVKAGHVLPFLREDGDDIHGCATRQADGHQLKGAKTVLIPANFPARPELDIETGIGFGIET